MDTNALKKFAQSARNLLIDQVRAKLDLVLDPASAARREHPRAMDELDLAIALNGKDQVIEQVAYTWFNRFSALRLMDANGYTSTGIVSPAAGQTRPEILAEAMAGNIPDTAPAAIAAILDGSTPSADPQAEAYRLLLVNACNEWHGPMPFLFEKLDDFSELLMPEDLLSQASILAEMRKVMTDDACQDVEIIGWLYQFYISEKKQQVFDGLKKNQKITAENIPAATQLFTPHWIVRYLVENSLGRLWLLNRPTSKLAAQMDYYIAPEEPETDFLRITKPEEIKICDPACGSGHMLTYGFDLLYAIYEEEGYEPTEIPGLILTHNLHGIEIDDRAGALAAFALSMKAATKLGRRRFLKLEAKPNICVLQNVHFTAAEMQDVLAVVGSDLFTNDFLETMGQFEQAKNFGSLIVPKLRDPSEVVRLIKLKDFSSDLLLREVQERVVAALRMAIALSPIYHVVVANPPYAGAKGLNAVTSNQLKKSYPLSKSDLYSAFIQRGMGFISKRGHLAMVTMESWMFLSSFEGLRSQFFEEMTMLSMVHMPYLGKGGTSMGINFGTAAFVSQKFPMPDFKGQFSYIRYFETDDSGVPLSFPVVNERLRSATTNKFFKIPGKPIAYWASDQVIKLFSDSQSIAMVAEPRQGLATADNDRFLRVWSEVESERTGFGIQSVADSVKSGKKWFPYNKGGEYRKWFGNNEFVVNWENDGEDIRNFSDKYGNVRSRPQNTGYYFRNGLTWTSTSSSYFGIRHTDAGFIFDVKGSSCFAPQELHYPLLGFLASFVATELLKYLNPTIEFQNGNIKTLPLADIFYEPGECSAISERVKTMCDIARCDWDSSETSWNFSALDLLSLSVCGETLGERYNNVRLQWRSATDEMQRLEEENNRTFIDAYGLQHELTPNVPIEEITLRCNPAHRYGGKASEAQLELRLLADTIAEFLSYAVGCMFGRYSLDERGLILANQGETLADYLARVPSPTFMPDEDNVIPVLDDNWFDDDVTERFRLFLRVTFGDEHFQENLKFIEDNLGKSIRRYFVKDFYVDHVKRYKKRPIYWMFSSPKGTFNALIYMHRYRQDTVSVLLNDYLREFISRLEAKRGRLEKQSIDPAASQAEQTKAEKEMGAIAKQIDELNDWEREVIFPLAQAKIEIDLDDGVKVNYPKFGTALKRIPGLEEKDD